MKILFLAKYIDELGNSSYGGSQRTMHIYNALCEYGDVEVLTLSLECYKSTKKLDNLNHIENWAVKNNSTLPVTKLPRLLPGKIASLVNYKNIVYEDYYTDISLSKKIISFCKTRDYSLIVSRYINPLFYLDLNSKNFSCPIFLDLDDDPVEFASNSIKQLKSTKDKLLEHTKKYELKKIVKNRLSIIDHVWYTKDQDEKRYSSICKSSSILQNIPNWKNIIQYDLNLDSEVILFVGRLAWGPNKRGLIRFIDENWERIISIYPKAFLKIVGVGLNDEEVKYLHTFKNVKYEGFVEDLKKCYEECLFSISPIYEGAGTKIKVLESLAFGRTCVVSDHTYEGLFPIFKSEENILVETKEAAFSEQCLKLLKNKEQAQKLANSGFSIVKENFSIDSFKDKVKESLSSVI